VLCQPASFKMCSMRACFILQLAVLFLISNLQVCAAAQQATEAAAEEAQGAIVTPQAEAPKFQFGAPPPIRDSSSAPAQPTSTTAVFSAASSAAAAPSFYFGAAATTPAGVFGFGAAASSAAASTPPVFGFGSGASSAAASPPADATVLATVAPASATGWGTAFLQVCLYCGQRVRLSVRAEPDLVQC
jgi:hypothetical protein